VRDDIAGVVLVGIGLVFGGSVFTGDAEVLDYFLGRSRVVLDRQRYLSAGVLIKGRGNPCDHDTISSLSSIKSPSQKCGSGFMAPAKSGISLLDLIY
jgi:hypothetical protein